MFYKFSAVRTETEIASGDGKTGMGMSFRVFPLWLHREAWTIGLGDVRLRAEQPVLLKIIHGSYEFCIQHAGFDLEWQNAKK